MSISICQDSLILERLVSNLNFTRENKIKILIKLGLQFLIKRDKDSFDDKSSRNVVLRRIVNRLRNLILYNVIRNYLRITQQVMSFAK